MLQRAEESRRIAEGAYREGATSLTQVLDAARALVDARDVYYRAVFARNQSLIELNAAIGSVNLLTISSGGAR
jgi:outer membrane protein TolC